MVASFGLRIGGWVLVWVLGVGGWFWFGFRRLEKLLWFETGVCVAWGGTVPT